MEKRRVIKSYENLTHDLKKLFDDQYREGYEDSVSRLVNAKGEPFFVVPFETEDANYMVKVSLPDRSDDEEEDDDTSKEVVRTGYKGDDGDNDDEGDEDKKPSRKRNSPYFDNDEDDDDEDDNDDDDD